MLLFLFPVRIVCFVKALVDEPQKDGCDDNKMIDHQNSRLKYTIWLQYDDIFSPENGILKGEENSWDSHRITIKNGIHLHQELIEWALERNVVLADVLQPQGFGG